MSGNKCPYYLCGKSSWSDPGLKKFGFAVGEPGRNSIWIRNSGCNNKNETENRPVIQDGQFLAILESLENTPLSRGWFHHQNLTHLPPGRTPVSAARQIQTEHTRNTKLQEFKNKLIPLYPEVPRFNESKNKLRAYADECPFTKMSHFQDLDVRRKIHVIHLEEKYPQIVENIMAEAKEQFKIVTHTAGVNLKVKFSKEEEGRYTIQPYVFLGKTEFYENYLFTKVEIQHKWVLHEHLVKKIFEECVHLLPETLCYINNLRSKPNDFKELDAIFTKHVEESENILKKVYNKILETVENDHTRVNPAIYNRILRTCDGLLSVYMGQAIHRTISHIVQCTASEDMVPYLKLSINYKDDKLVLQPTESDLILIYTLFITKLVECGNKFIWLEYYKKKNAANLPLKIFVTEEAIDQALEDVAENILILYEPINAYVQKLDEDFAEIYGQMGNIEDSDKNNKTNNQSKFNSGVDKINHYHEYLMKASRMLSSEYFAVGQLILSEYVITMKESVSHIIGGIFSELCGHHIWENEAICEEFQNLRKFALTKPSTTEDLIKQGKYMIWVKTVFLNDLKERIQQMLYNLTKLIQFGDLSKDHMELNADTVMWIKNIEPVLEQNSSMYEQLKFEYEELLATTIKGVNSTIDKLVPMLGTLDDMDNFDQCRDYVNKIKVHMVVIRDLRRKITWIVKEQECLGFKPTSFQNAEEVENWLYPFFHLLKVCMNIQRHINVWMDGQFEFLNYDETEQKVEEYIKELLKIQKTYRMKLRQAQSENSKLRFFGIVDDPDLYAWPAPLKLTANGIQRLKDFRPAMTLMRIMCNDALMRRHWREMSAIAGFDLTPNAGTSLRKLTLLGLEPDLDKYDVISSSATKERQLLKNLTKMQKEWDEVLFKTGSFKDTGVAILTQLDDIQSTAEARTIFLGREQVNIWMKN